MMERTLMQRLLDAGYPSEDLGHHESDLYVYVTAITKPIVEAFYREHGLAIEWHAPIFRDNETGKLMYDCMFMYDDFWKEKC